MKLAWVSDFNTIGVGYGYSTHQKRLREAVEGLGVEIDPMAKVAIHITTCDRFEPIRGRVNVLYSMYEATSLPKTWIGPLAGADLIVVPCRQNAVLFQQYTDVPVVVVTEGVDIEAYRYVERQPRRPFTFLWCGATNPRKGTRHVIQAWEQWRAFEPRANETCLIMKTTQQGDQTVQMQVEAVEKDGTTIVNKTIEQELPAERVVSVPGNAIVDTRRLPVRTEGYDDVPQAAMYRSMVEMYQAADCFLLPSMGEGFGLTLAEAVATGLPSIYTPWGGPVDFMRTGKGRKQREFGYPVKWHLAHIRAIVPGTGVVSHTSSAASADIDSILQRMRQVFYGHRRALARAREGAIHIRRGFTWEASGRLFLSRLAEAGVI